VRPAVDPFPRRAIGEFDSYTEALRAAEFLADGGVPPEKVAILGRDIQTVEQVARRTSTAQAALAGAIEGGLLGAFFGILVALTFSLEPDVAVPLLVLYGLLWGTLLGGVLGALLHAALGLPRRPPAAPAPGAEGPRYEIVVDEDVAAPAEQILRPLAD
jgi:hypothetical protein